MRIILWIFYTVLAVLFLWLAIANRAIVRVSLDPFEYAVDMPLFFVLVLGMALGLLILGPQNAWRRWRLKRQVRNLARDKDKLSKTLAEMTAERDRLQNLMREGDGRIEAAQKTGVYEDGDTPALLPPSK